MVAAERISKKGAMAVESAETAEKAGASSAIVKKEISKQPPACIAGLEGKQLHSAFNYALSKAGPEAMAAYEPIKHQKSSNAEKFEFMRAIIMKDWEPTTTKKIKRDDTVEGGEEKSIWRSWEKVKDVHGAAVARAMVASGTLATRPHTRITEPHLSGLDPEERFEYKDIKESEIKGWSSTDRLEREQFNEGDIPEVEGTGENQSAEVVPPPPTLLQVKQMARRQYTTWSGQSAEYKMRLGKFDGNECLWPKPCWLKFAWPLCVANAYCQCLSPSPIATI